MCNPLLILRAAATAFTIISSSQKAKADRNQAIHQNDIALQARREKENAENLRLRQIAIRKKEKIEETQLQSKEAQATARTAAETVGGAALDRVVNNYLRTEGKYVSTIEKNLEIEAAQSDTNKRLFAIEQEGRQVHIPEVNTAGIFAAGAISFGGDFFEWKARKDAKDLAQKRHDDMMKRMIS
jgi:hypothetical protein